jgi:hypothetical protein
VSTLLVYTFKNYCRTTLLDPCNNCTVQPLLILGSVQTFKVIVLTCTNSPGRNIGKFWKTGMVVDSEDPAVFVMFFN